MKKVIRYGMFETNSSSCHSVTVKGKYNKDDYVLIVNHSGIISVYLDEYGWNGDPCDDFQSKLAYAMSMVLNTEYPDFQYWNEDFFVDENILEELDGYKMLLNAINERCKCKQIVIKRRRDFYPYGYIDHQSCEYASLQDFLDDWNVDVNRFLFDDNVVVHIDNDNH